ncbi:hypothetical protein KCP76_09820 [Salmonella enterica subsp. enterica serovar Weltevreden]|nr:hypothetical protein KCP76_09820 [Salmonella enterica subsp. enterica serovar Weltevreden]
MASLYISEDRKRDGLACSACQLKENMSLTARDHFSRAGGSLKHKDEQQAVGILSALFNVKIAVNGTGDSPVLLAVISKVASRSAAG